MKRIKILITNLDPILLIMNLDLQFHPQIEAIIREGINIPKACQAIINQL